MAGKSSTPSEISNILSFAKRIGYHNLGGKELRWWLFDTFSNNIIKISVAGTTARFHVTNQIEYHRFRTLSGERPVLEDFLMEIKPGDIVWDVGANVGLYGCLASSRLENDVSVTAFEPHPANVRRLKQNTQLNDLNMAVFGYGLSESRNSVQLSVEQDLPGAGGPRIDQIEGSQTVTVDVYPGDDLISEHGHPDVIKIDVEGHEWKVLQGLRDTISTGHCRTIYCEIHDYRLEDQGVRPEMVKQYFSEYGFEIKQMPINRSIWKATR